MSKTIEEFFDEVTPAEASALLEGIKTYERDELAAARIRKKVLSAAAGREASLKKMHAGSISRRALRRAAAVAAALAVLTGAVFGAGALAEAKEFREAKTYLEEHSILTEKLTRNETKEVCRDIRNGAFALDITKSAMERSYQAGYSPARSGLDTDYFRSETVSRTERYNVLGELQDDGAYYVEEHLTASDLDLESTETDVKIVRTEYVKYRMGKEIWRYGFEDGLWTFKSFPMRDGLFLIRISSSDSGRVSFIKLADGAELWRRDMTDFPYAFRGCCASEETDGGITLVFLEVSERALGEVYPAAAVRLSPAGEIIGSFEFESRAGLNLMTPDDCCPFEGGYAVLMHDPWTGLPDFAGKPDTGVAGDKALVLFDGEGRILEIIEDEALCAKLGEGDYRIFNDMREYGGRLWFSVTDMTVIPTSAAETSEESLLELVKQTNTARLAVFDPEDGSFTVLPVSESGAMGSVLNIDADGKLLWNVNLISRLVSAGAKTDRNDIFLDSLHCRVECDIVQCVISEDAHVAARIDIHGCAPYETTGLVPDGYSQILVPAE